MHTMNRQQIALAIQAGMELLSDKSDIAIPARLLDGASLLKLLLRGIAQGEVSIAPVLQQEEGVVEDVDPNPEAETGE